METMKTYKIGGYFYQYTGKEAARLDLKAGGNTPNTPKTGKTGNTPDTPGAGGAE
ncbi:MAG: hypothetical protein LBS91_02980 [Clostridiales Family XIII bacterium]|jgi:hypothetical protein|nr:hypothetical protein [Clostridiales Family XIII bacterium]